MGDGTGCDNMTAVIAKLKPTAFKEVKTENKRNLEAETESEPPAKKVKTENEAKTEES